jgi:hypothetical protein
MGRPKGSKNKAMDGLVEKFEGLVDEAAKTPGIPEMLGVAITREDVVETIKNAGGKHEEERKEAAKAVILKPKLEPLGPGQKYFEAPSGEILIGEEDANHMWWRAGNGGKGMFINPKR